MFLSLKMLPSACSEQIGRAMRKHAFGHMRTAKVQISLRIRDPECFIGDQMPG